MTVGVHIIADLYGVNGDRISRTEDVCEIVEEAVRVGKLTKISSDYFQFQPRGVSGIVLLAESHLAFHAWPEHELVTLDIYTCGDPSHADAAYEYLIERLNPTSVEYKRISRGTMLREEVKSIKPEHIIIQ